MSYAIIRNEKYKRENLKGIFRHNERRNKNYSNKNIDKTKSYLNYSIKSPKYNYEKELDILRKKYNLKGQVKTVSNIACEYVITSDKEFFDRIGSSETKRYFETAHKFVCEYKSLTEKYILSSIVHMDEKTPHLHLIFVPVVHTKDKNGNNIDKIACSEFWKSKNSYIELQDAFYKYMKQNNFILERGCSSREHLSVEAYKEITNFKQNENSTYPKAIPLQVPSLNDISKFSLNRDKEITECVILPLKQENIKLCEQNNDLTTKLNKLTKDINNLHNYEKENKKLQQRIKTLINEKYDLKDQVHYLNKLVKVCQKILSTFIDWICNKLQLNKDKTIEQFENECNMNIEPTLELKNDTSYEDEMEWD